MTNDQVDHRSAAASRDEDQVQMARDLMGGTAAMRQAAGRYLYKAPAESPKSHEYRLKVATLFPAYKRTVEVLAGKRHHQEDVLRLQRLLQSLSLFLLLLRFSQRR